MKLLTLFSVLIAAARMSFGADAPWNELYPNSPLVPAGVKVTVAFDRPQYFLGESVNARFTVENTGAEPIKIHLGSDYSGSVRADRFIVTATDEAGHQAIDPFPGAASMGGLGGYSTIGPGGKHTEVVPVLRYCQFDHPGRYTVRISHDLGWNKRERPYPVGEGTVTFVEPTAAQAEQMVARMEKPQGNGESADFSVLHLPVFLAPLQRRAEAGDEKALEGVGSIESKEATEVLIRLANGKNKELALQAALNLNARLPDPQFDKKLPARSPYVDPGMEVRNRLAVAAWDERFAPRVRALAVKYLAEEDQRSIACGAFMVESIGTPREAPVVEAAIERALASTRKDRHDSEVNILNVPEPVGELQRAMHMLHLRGYELGASLKGDAQAYVYFDWLADQPGPRPQEWTKRFEAYRGNSSHVIREAVYRSVPQTIPDACVDGVMKGLADRDFGVQRAVCELAGKSGDRRFVDPVLKIIATNPHEWVLREATNAVGYGLKAHYELYRAWVARMADNENMWPAFEGLSGVIDTTALGGSGNVKLPREERLAIQHAWQVFLAKHEQELRAGRRYKLGGPELTPEMYGRARRYQLPDGKEWPPLPAGAAVVEPDEEVTAPIAPPKLDPLELPLLSK